MSDRETEIKDILFKDILKDELKKKKINVYKITSYNCSVSEILEEFISKKISIKRGEILRYELISNNVRIITEASLVNKYGNNNLYENINYIIEIAHPCKDDPRERLIRYNNIFEDPAYKIKKIRFHTTGDKYNNINSLVSSREEKVERNKIIILKTIKKIDISGD